MAIFIYSQSFYQKSAERKLPKKYFRILIWCLAWSSNPGFSTNKPTHYLLDHDVCSSASKKVKEIGILIDKPNREKPKTKYCNITLSILASSFQMMLVLIYAGMQTSKIVAFAAQKTRTHTLKSRCTQTESLFSADFGLEA